MKKETLKVTGMSCRNCVRHVREALLSVPGVEKAEVDLQSGNAVVTCRDEVSKEELARSVEEEGYAVGE